MLSTLFHLSETRNITKEFLFGKLPSH